MKETKNAKSTEGCRLNRVGGQAVLEGVMMKAGERTVTTCRKEDGTLVVTDDRFVSVRKKYKFLNIPILRGVINFVEMMALSVKTLGNSAEAMGLEEEEPTKFEKWMKEKLKINITDFIMVISVILGLALSLGLFLFLPIWIIAGVNFLLDLAFGVTMNAVISSIVEGLTKMGIFVAYLALVSLMPDIKRTFMYHGAEHKSIACFEAGEELTPENAAKHRRFHPRCGTSFMFFMILLGIFAGIVIKSVMPGIETWLYTIVRLLILPLVMGLGYEIIMFAGKHDNVFTRILSAPGLWVQRITTKEPTIDMLEVAIVSIKCALRDDFPEFHEFFESRAWEPVKEAVVDGETENESAAENAAAAEDIANTDAADITADKINPDNEAAGTAACENAPTAESVENDA